MAGIEFDQDKMERIHALLSDLPQADVKVLKPALNRGLSATRTQAAKQVTKTYRIKSSDVKQFSKVTYKGMSKTGNQLVGSINYAGSVIPLYKFTVSPKAPDPKHQKGTVKAAVKKGGSLIPIKEAFIATVGGGHLGVFERKETKRLPTEEKFGPSVPKMIGNDEVMQSIEDRANEVISARIEHEISRLLSNGG